MQLLSKDGSIKLTIIKLIPLSYVQPLSLHVMKFWMPISSISPPSSIFSISLPLFQFQYKLIYFSLFVFFTLLIDMDLIAMRDLSFHF